MGNLLIAYARICLITMFILKNIFVSYQDNFIGNWEFELQESMETVDNPYQGDYVQVDSGNPQRLYSLREKYDGCHMVFLAYNLKPYAANPVIPDSKIQQLRNCLEISKELNLSVIFRAAYDFDGKYTDPEFSVILSHIRQISSILNTYKSCLAGVQAGMIGAYGEWNQTEYGTAEHHVQVIKAWEESLDSQIAVSVRRQQFIREAADAGLDTKRLGIYNDGLFSSDTDLGTYMGDYGREQELEWSQTNIQTPFNGGEMPYISKYTDIVNVVKEAGQLQLSYLNRLYNVEVWDYWKTQTYEGIPADEYIKGHLGARLYVSKIKISKNYRYRRRMSVELELQNSGFAMLGDGYKAYLSIRYNGKVVQQEAELTVKSKQSITVSGNLDNTFYDGNPQEVSIGLKLCRDNQAEGSCFQLVNQGNDFESGTNWFWND